MYAVFKAAQAHGHVLIDLNDDGFGAITHRLQMRAPGAEVEPAVLIHGGHLEHGHIQGLDAVPVIARQLGIAQGDIVGKALPDGFPLNAAHMPGIPCKMAGGVRHVEDGRPAGQNAAPDVHVLQFPHPGGQGLVQGVGRADRPAIIQPVAGLHDLDGLTGAGQLLTVFLLIAHSQFLHMICFSASSQSAKDKFLRYDTFI